VRVVHLLSAILLAILAILIVAMLLRPAAGRDRTGAPDVPRPNADVRLLA
jgi:hypothetical protein